MKVKHRLGFLVRACPDRVDLVILRSATLSACRYISKRNIITGDMSVARPTSLDYAVLGLLAERPMSGYDLIVQFRQTPLIRFSPSAGSMYHWRLITGKADRSHRLRPREIYQPTREGERRLFDWLFSAITRDEVATKPDELNLKFALMEGVGSSKDAVGFLKDYQRNMRDYQIELIQFHEERGEVMGRHWRLCLELGIRRYGENADWAQGAIASLGRRGTGGPKPSASRFGSAGRREI